MMTECDRGAYAWSTPKISRIRNAMKQEPPIIAANTSSPQAAATVTNSIKHIATINTHIAAIS